PKRSAIRPGAPQHRRPDAEIDGAESSWRASCGSLWRLAHGSRAVPMLPQTEVPVLTEPCNFAEKALIWVKFISSSPPYPQAGEGRVGAGCCAALKMLQFEGYTLDIARNSLRTADRKVALRRKSFELLRYLAENPDRVVTKEE